MTIAESINKLADKLAGEPTNGGETIEQAVDNLTEYAGGGGGGGATIVTVDSDNKASMTAGEIVNAVNNGAIVMLKTGSRYFQLSTALKGESNYCVVKFTFSDEEDGGLALEIASIIGTTDSDVFTFARYNS